MNEQQLAADLAERVWHIDLHGGNVDDTLTWLVHRGYSIQFGPVGVCRNTLGRYHVGIVDPARSRAWDAYGDGMLWEVKYHAILALLYDPAPDEAIVCGHYYNYHTNRRESIRQLHKENARR